MPRKGERLNDMKSVIVGLFWARCTVCRVDFKDLNAKLLPLPAQISGSFHGYDAQGGSQAGWIVISSSQGGRQELKVYLEASCLADMYCNRN